jgi:hypothetical protein
MRIFVKIAAAAIVPLAVAGLALPAASASVRPDVTSSCGANCVDAHFIVPGKRYLPEVFLSKSGTAGKNSKLDLDYASNSDPAEDFIPSGVGTIVPTYCTKSGHSAGGNFSNNQCNLLVNLGYGGDEAYEDQYAPGGFGSGLCVGVWNNARTLSSTAAIRMEACGESPDTVLVIAPSIPDESATAADGGDFVVDGASNNFSDPFVATASSSTTLPTLLHWAQASVDLGSGTDTQSLRFQPGPYSA